MNNNPSSQTVESLEESNAPKTVLILLFALSFCHLLTDVTQSIVPAIYPLLKHSFQLSFLQIGLIALTSQCVGSILQPIIGFYTDRYPKPLALAVGMGFSMGGTPHGELRWKFHWDYRMGSPMRTLIRIPLEIPSEFPARGCLPHPAKIHILYNQRNSKGISYGISHWTSHWNCQPWEVLEHFMGQARPHNFALEKAPLAIIKSFGVIVGCNRL